MRKLYFTDLNNNVHIQLVQDEISLETMNELEKNENFIGIDLLDKDYENMTYDKATNTIIFDVNNDSELIFEITNNRDKRNRLLTQSDYILMPDYPISEVNRNLWISYRQKLRDLDYKTNPNNVVWPDVPTIK